MRPSLDSFERASEDIFRLPAGREMCNRIRDALQRKANAQATVDSLWLQIGFDLVYCAGFPATEFEAILSGDDFDVRWPLTFTCWYFGSSGASVDQACAHFLRRMELWGEAHEVLPEYTGEQWLSAWRKRFEELRRPKVKS